MTQKFLVLCMLGSLAGSLFYNGPAQQSFILMHTFLVIEAAFLLWFYIDL